MNLNRYLLTLFLLAAPAMAVGLFPAIANAQTTIAADNADNYSGTWANASNEGSGFEAWSLTSAGGTDGFAGHFIGDPSAAGISGMNSSSFGLFANPNVEGNFAYADRTFSESLSVGRTFSFQWGVNFDSDNPDGSKGVILYSGGTSGTALITIEMSNSAEIRINGTAMFSEYETNAMTINVERKSTTELRVYATGRDGSESYDDTFTIDSASEPNAIRFYAQRLDAGDQRQPYLNNLRISQAMTVTLATPADAANDVTLRPTLTWNSVSDADTYNLQISTSSDFSSTVVNETELTSTSYTPSLNLLMGTQYYWRVSATNEGGTSAWSSTRTFTTISPTLTLRGNGGAGFGDVLGSATMGILHDDTYVYFQLNKGIGNFNDMLVLYLDTKDGGLSSTSSLNDVTDNHRKAISGKTASATSNLTFPTGFTADFAVASNTTYAGLWNFSDLSSFGLVTELTKPANSTNAHYSFRINRADIALTTAVDFKLVATYLNPSDATRSNESFSIGFTETNPGAADASIRSHHVYPSGDIAADIVFFNQSGWRFISNPFTGKTLNDYLASLWTQGFTGSDYPAAGAAASNVRIYDGTNYVSVGSQSDPMSRGKGFAVGVYQDDTMGVSGTFPKTVSVTGSPDYAAVSPDLNNNSQFALVGNPFPFAVDFDEMTKTGLTEVVYVYDYVAVDSPVTGDQQNTGGAGGVFRSWNGSVGSLTGGHVAPFQGFLVYSNAESASLTIDADDRSTPVVYRGKEVANEPMVLSLELVGEGLYSTAWVHFSDDARASDGLDPRDAFKLYPFSADYALMQTYARDGSGLEINHLPISGEAVTLPMDMQVTRSGSFVLRTTDWSLPEGWTVTLVDDQTGSSWSLNGGQEIVLELEASGAMAKRAADGLTPEVVTLDGSSRFRLKVEPGQTTSIDGDPSLPQAFALEQNYPNPFNPVTTIRYAVPASVGAGAGVRLSVYDLLGREVAVLVDEVRAAGSHQVSFDASALGSGVYLYRLTAGAETITRRMTLIK